MATTQLQDTGLVQRGLLLLGGMTALVVVVLLIALRGPETPTAAAERPDLVVPAMAPVAAFPASVAWPLFVQVAQQLPSAPGWEIRYNAAAALARRGSPSTPWPLIREMLDLDRQRRNFRITLKNGKETADEESAQRTVQNALAAVAQWHAKQDRAAITSAPADLQVVYDQVDRLAQGTNAPVRVHADRVRQTFLRK
jgi:hypothetical protein